MGPIPRRPGGDGSPDPAFQRSAVVDLPSRNGRWDPQRGCLCPVTSFPRVGGWVIFKAISRESVDSQEWVLLLTKV